MAFKTIKIKVKIKSLKKFIPMNEGLTPDNPMQLPNIDVTMGANNISQKGIDLITHFEGIKLEAYQDSAGIWTIGIGATFYEDFSKVKEGDKISNSRALSLFHTVLRKFELKVLEKVKRPLKQHEFDASVSFCYNAGTSYKTAGGTWKDFDLWGNINRNMPTEEMKQYWESLAVTAGGQKLNGLVRRRKSEAHLYCTGEFKYFE